MKKIGFIGAMDKNDIITYVAKALEQLNYKVLVIDATMMQKSKYLVPTINPTKSYLANYENVDYAIGFDDFQEIIDYLGNDDLTDTEKLPYDYVIIDTDRVGSIESFNMLEDTKNYFVTNFEMYSLQRGVEILKNLPDTITLSKILCNYHMKKEDEDFLIYLSTDARVIWDDFTIYMPILDENQQLLEENQRLHRIRLKKLIPEYQDGIIYIVQNILKDISINKIRKMIKE